MSQATPPQPQRPSIVATVIQGECRGASVTVDRSELIDLIRRQRQVLAADDDQVDPGAFTIGRHPYGDNHLYLGCQDPAISAIHLRILPIEEDAVRVTHCGRVGNVAVALGTVTAALVPGQTQSFPLPLHLTLGNPASKVAITQADPSPAVEDGASAWLDLEADQRRADNGLIAAATGLGLAELGEVIRAGFAADRVVVAGQPGILATAGGTCDPVDASHLWQWYAFNGRAYRLLRHLTVISQGDGRSPDLGHGIVLRLFQGGTYLFVLRRGAAFSTIDRERLARVAWYLLGVNAGQPDWYPRMHLEDHEPGHLRRLVDHQWRQHPDLRGATQSAALARIAPRITRETGIIFPRRTRKPLSLNAGLDIPRRHQGLAHGSQSRYYGRLTDMLELFVADHLLDSAPPVDP